MRNLKLKSWFTTTLAILFLSGCGSTTTAVEEERLVFKEDVEINIASVIYSEEKNNYNVEYTSNLPYNLEFTATLYDSEKNIIGKRKNVVVEEDYDGGQYRDIEIEPSKISFENLKEIDVYFELVIVVDGSEEMNTALLSYFDRGGGYYDEVSEQYKESEYVKITPSSPETFNAYTMTIKSDPYTIQNYDIIDSTEEIEEEQVISYSADFKNYNTRYYEQFRNQMDLIASNFEILAMDGFENQDIVDDLIVWTSEFNELLEVYAMDSIPMNEIDQELYNHTVEMIAEQQLVNDNIINGLTQYDETKFFTSGDHLEVVTGMYLAGYNLLTY